MSAAKHTPGPWSLFPSETGWILNGAGGPGYVGTLPSISHRREECEANAALIAAAPELLEALEPFAKFACSPPGCCNCHNCRARDVIAKATERAA